MYVSVDKLERNIYQDTLFIQSYGFLSSFTATDKALFSTEKYQYRAIPSPKLLWALEMGQGPMSQSNTCTCKI